MEKDLDIQLDKAATEVFTRKYTIRNLMAMLVEDRQYKYAEEVKYLGGIFNRNAARRK